MHRTTLPSVHVGLKFVKISKFREFSWNRVLETPKKMLDEVDDTAFTPYLKMRNEVRQQVCEAHESIGKAHVDGWQVTITGSAIILAHLPEE